MERGGRAAVYIPLSNQRSRVGEGGGGRAAVYIPLSNQRSRVGGGG